VTPLILGTTFTVDETPPWIGDTVLWITPIVLLVTLLLVLSIVRSQRRIRHRMAGRGAGDLERVARLSAPK
jgi:cytochrome c-type biogenesis protein CcmH/NrfF